MRRPWILPPFALMLGVTLALGPTGAAFAQQSAEAYNTAEPQKTGWPLSKAEKAYVLKPEHERRPGSEKNQYLPKFWPVTPSAGFWGGTSWLDTHAKLVETAKAAAAAGPFDVLLVGDSITMQWGDSWARHLPQYKSVNIGIGGDKTQNVLWRLDHGGADGLKPRAIVLMIGVNNLFAVPETGVGPVALGVKACADSLRKRFPEAHLIVTDIIPAHTPGDPFYDNVKKTNDAIEALKLEADPKVHRLRLWTLMVEPDGSLKKGLFTSDNVHLTPDGGYALYARELRPVLERLLGDKRTP